MARKLTAMEEFRQHLENMSMETSDLAVSGDCEIEVTKRMVCTYHIKIRNSKRDISMQFNGSDPKELAWKLVGIQANISKINWDLTEEPG